MLRFDLPAVSSNVIRWEAVITFVVCNLALFVSPWFMAVLVVQALVKGFIGHYKCPSHLLWKRIFDAQGWTGAMVNAGAKMFAAVIPPKRAASKSRINTSPAFSAGRVSLLKPSYAFALE